MLVLGIATVLSPQLLFAQEEKDYWAGTGLSESHLRQLVTKKNCYKNENNFLGCISAINYLFITSEKRLVLTNSHTEKFTNLVDTNNVIEGFKLKEVQVTPETKKPIEAMAERKERQTITNRSWKSVYKLTLKKKIAIDKILSEALNSTKKDSMTTKYALAINEYLSVTIDPHTYIKPLSADLDQRSATESDYSGIGAYLRAIGESVVLEPIEESPALKAGVRYLDVLTHVEGEPVDPSNLNEITKKLRGPDNTKVNVTLMRDGKPLNISITRGKIVRKNIEAKVMQDVITKEKIGVIKVRSFMQSKLCLNFVNLAREVHRMGARSLILDLRDNGGGSLDEALCMAATYVPGGMPLLMQQDPYSDKAPQITFNFLPKPFFVREGELYDLFQRPLVVLVNARSASASELLPGSIGAQKRVVVVGERTFGKGTVQYRLPDLGSVGLQNAAGVVLYRTVSRFEFPDGTSNQLHGITPDFEVYPSPNPTEDEKFAYREADLYPNAIAPTVKPRGMKAELKSKVSSCVEAQKESLAREYENAKSGATAPDYQLMYAREVARCL